MTNPDPPRHLVSYCPDPDCDTDLLPFYPDAPPGRRCPPCPYCGGATWRRDLRWAGADRADVWDICRCPDGREHVLVTQGAGDMAVGECVRCGVGSVHDPEEAR